MEGRRTGRSEGQRLGVSDGRGRVVAVGERGVGERVPAYRLERDPRPHRLLGENHRHGLPLEGLERRVPALDLGLNVLRPLQHVPDLVRGPVVDVKEMLVTLARVRDLEAAWHGVRPAWGRATGGPAWAARGRQTPAGASARGDSRRGALHRRQDSRHRGSNSSLSRPPGQAPKKLIPPLPTLAPCSPFFSRCSIAVFF